MKYVYLTRSVFVSRLLPFLCILLTHYAAFSQANSSVNGVVRNDRGEPVSGVSVIVRNSTAKINTGTSTDSAGVFRFATLPVGSGYSFTVSSVGYENQTLAGYELKAGEPLMVTIQVKEAAGTLNEVVVVGYGTQRKREVSGSIASLRANDLKDQPVANIEQAIAGRLPGVQVLQNSGAPGGSISVRIRGLNSISAGVDPLYVVDGFPLSNDLKNLQGSTDLINITGAATFQKAPNPLSSLNTDDIETIEVLKDASAAAIYGSRASNGVVIITTKKGRKGGDPLLTYSSYYGVQQVSKKIKMMDAYQFSKLAYDAKNNAYLDAVPTANINDNNTVRGNANYQLPPEILPYLNNTPGLTNTDWQDAIFRAAPMQNHTLSASGGGERVQYYLSGNFFDQRGIVIASGFKRYGLRANINADLTPKLKVGLNLNPSYNYHDLVNTEGPFIYDGVINNALKAAPIFPVYNPDGSDAVNFQNTWAYNYSGGENPVALATQISDKLEHVRNLGNIYGEYALLKNLSFRTMLATDINYFGRNFYRPSTLGTYRPIQQGAPTNPKGSSQTAIAKNWLWENTLNYNFDIGQNHKFNTLLGYTSQKNQTSSNQVDATNFPNNSVQTLNAGTVNGGNSFRSEWSLVSLLGRINYNFSDKYFLTASLRRDGSSRFGANNKWGYFPAVSGAWLVTAEDFFAVPAVSELKVRASYGLTGNFQITNYGAYDLLSANNYVFGTGNGSTVNGAGLSQPANPDLTWEKTSQFNLGLDIGLVKNRVYLTADYYQSKTKDLLLNVPTPLSSGFATALKNVGRVENKGVELGVTSRNTTGAFKWTTNFNISANRNKVLQLGPNGAPIISDGGVASLFITQIGKPIGSYYGYVNGGVFMNQKEIDEYPHYTTTKPGDRKFIDVNGDKKIDANDRTSIGSYFPDFIAGLTNEFSYKGFDLSIVFQTVQGNEILNLQRRYLFNMEGNANQYIEANDYWKSPTEPGNGNVMRANRVTNANSAQISSFHVEDGSFVRLRNLTLGYTLQGAWVNNKIKSLRLYVSGQNLYTWTKYLGYNPEVNARPDNSLSQGEDYGSYPLSRTIIAGLNLSF
ncbi:TonB-dependent receptor [Segetibacter sp. 3557_3]|uniref:SusC/RagA family TonB-linked outer membrane protein n=1 Tax=Segetibacter sp. 3557_3 TaxID=2547429 RepID=UPI001058F53C|nr:TonB-dependent receptor [Segetibacter sp. 3557_3]TDH21278.1 TonB-dependent receptor [Segetibacter sp. 3557_3]